MRIDGLGGAGAVVAVASSHGPRCTMLQVSNSTGAVCSLPDYYWEWSESQHYLVTLAVIRQHISASASSG